MEAVGVNSGMLHYTYIGTRHCKGLQALTRLLVHHGHGVKPCPLCDENELNVTLIDDILMNHQQDLGVTFTSLDGLLTWLVDCDIHFVYKFWKLSYVLELCIMLYALYLYIFSPSFFVSAVPIVGFHR